MNLSSKFGIKENTFSDIINIFEKYPSVERVLVFGSRAKGTFKETSDIDICIFGDNIDSSKFLKIMDEIEEINTATEFDILLFNQLSKEKLKNNILKDGVEIYAAR